MALRRLCVRPAAFHFYASINKPESLFYFCAPFLPKYRHFSKSSHQAVPRIQKQFSKQFVDVGGHDATKDEATAA